MADEVCSIAEALYHELSAEGCVCQVSHGLGVNVQL